jgi:hypothetical protein
MTSLSSLLFAFLLGVIALPATLLTGGECTPQFIFMRGPRGPRGRERRPIKLTELASFVFDRNFP